MNELLTLVGLFVLGIFVGGYGTIIGAGGGFLLVPLLLLIYPDDSPEQITRISLAVVFVNALSGTAAYVRQKRVDFLAANLFAVATIPGAIIGALVTSLIPRQAFDIAFAFLLIAVSALLTLRPTPRVVQRTTRKRETTRILTDGHGDTYIYSYNLMTGIALSLLVGFVASLLGIGGGIMHVPMMVQLLHFPAHIATATSQYVLTITAFTGTLVHLLSGEFDSGFDVTGALALGVLIGAQAGAQLSGRIGGRTIVRLLGLALGAVGVRLLLGSLL